MLIWQVQLSDAVREGTANAEVMIQRYEREGNFAKAALWHEAAADCLKIISVPMIEIQIRYYVHQGKNALGRPESWRVSGPKGTAGISSEGCEGTLGTDQKRTELQPELAAEHEKTTQFISTWAQSLLQIDSTITVSTPVSSK